MPNAETCDWQTLSQKRGLELESFYNQMLRSLGSESGTLGQIFVKSQNKIQDPSKLLIIIERDKTNLDIFWIKDKSLTNLDNLPDPDILAQEIIENIEAGLNSFKEIMTSV